MALIQCPECKKSISDKAKACPNCGFPIDNPPTQDPTKALPPKTKSTPKPGCAGCASILIGVFFGLLALSWAFEKIAQWWQTPKPILVASWEFGDKWPLTVTHGEVVRMKKRHGQIPVVFVAPDGTKYALNGAAKTAGYPDIEPIQRYQIDALSGKRYQDLYPLISIGLDRRK